MKTHVKLAILLPAVLLAAIAAAADPAAKADAGAKSSVADVAPGVVDAATARRLVAAGVKVVDVRTPAEFAAGHVPGAVNIPYDEMERRYGELGPATTKLLLYCHSGRRSGIAIQTLRAHGFDQLYDLRSYELWVRSEPVKGRH